MRLAHSICAGSITLESTWDWIWVSSLVSSLVWLVTLDQPGRISGGLEGKLFQGDLMYGFLDLTQTTVPHGLVVLKHGADSLTRLWVTDTVHIHGITLVGSGFVVS